MSNDSKTRRGAGHGWPGGLVLAIAGLLAQVLPMASTVSMAHTELPGIGSGGAAQDGILAPGYGRLDFTAPVPGTYALPPIKAAADGRVLTSNGESTTLHELYDGKIVVLSFIYSSCADENGCPLATFVLRQLKARLEQDSALTDTVKLLSLSFDPQRDTPEVMRLHEQAVPDGGTDWDYVTTASAAELNPILAAYGQSLQREPDGKDARAGAISHVLRVYLIDGQKRIRNIYSVPFLHVDILMADIRTLGMPGGGPERQPRTAAQETAAGLDERLSRIQNPPIGLPPAGAGLPTDPATFRLGERLFFDRRLSANSSLSCAHCHIPSQGFTSTSMARAVGFEGRSLRRNAPSLYNVAYMQRLFVDGREFSLEAAVWDELLNYATTGNRDVGGTLSRIEAAAGYGALFEQAFPGTGVSMQTVAKAIAAYMRTLVSADSPFDRWRYGGQEGAVSASARRGFELFTGPAGCAACHTVGPKDALFTDNRLHNTGIGWYRSMHDDERVPGITIGSDRVIEVAKDALAGTEEKSFNDLGLYEATQHPADRWAYRTPSLRNIAQTAPYMHDGSIASLEDVVDYYDRGGFRHELIDERIRPLGLTAQDKADLVAFMRTLTGSNIDALAQRITADERTREGHELHQR